MKQSLVVASVLAMLVAGCGGGGHPKPAATPATTPHPTATTDAPAESSPAALRKAVDSALRMNARLSTYVLWHNTVPSWARQSTGGPALSSLRSSATNRRAHGIRIRTQAQHLSILSIKIDPSYLRATAHIHASGSVVPHEKGHKTGRAIRLNERARIELHRVSKTTRFVVWKVTAAR